MAADAAADARVPRRPAGERVGVAFLMPREALLLLILAQLAVVLPLVPQLSPWILFVGVLCLGWRWLLFRSAWAYPSRWLKTLLALAAAAGVAFSGGELLSLETATALLVVAFALKLIEMRSYRDAYLILLLCYFIIATKFLFDQSIGVAGYQWLAAMLVTAALVALHQAHGRARVTPALKLSAALLLQALPLTLVLFLFVPRAAPLWSVPQPGGSETGMGDEVRPGDVSRLARSDEIAFRVVFDGRVPRLREMYWRGLVYSDYESGSWRQRQPRSRRSGPWQGAAPTSSRRRGRGDAPSDRPLVGLHYQVLLEATQRRWLFGLETPFPRSEDISLTRDYRLLADEPVTSLRRYRVESVPQMRIDRELPAWLRRRETRLPEGGNPRMREFAEALRAESGSAEAYVEAVLAHIRDEPFRYTLQPEPLESRHDADRFWFDTRSGFCTHFAGAFVIAMRAVGIPARMVGGYQGGEINPRTGHLVVRQYDAHAWAEIWLEGRGWVRVDPTSAVAPNRIEQGLDAALSDADRSSLSLLTNARFGRYPTLADVLGFFESLEHRWNLHVLGYDADRQGRLLEGLLGAVTPARIAAAILTGGAASIALVAALLFLRRRPPGGDPAERVLARFSRRLAPFGLERRAAETPRGYFERIGERLALRGADPAAARRLGVELETLLYAPGDGAAQAHRTTAQAGRVRALRRGLRRLQLELAWSAAKPSRRSPHRAKRSSSSPSGRAESAQPQRSQSPST